MKIAIKCFEHLSNKGNGRKCKLGPRNDKKLPDCVFKKNGMNSAAGAKQKEAYLSSLAIMCKRWHERNDQSDHFFAEICPQLEKTCEQFQKEKKARQKEKILSP